VGEERLAGTPFLPIEKQQPKQSRQYTVGHQRHHGISASDYRHGHGGGKSRVEGGKNTQDHPHGAEIVFLTPDPEHNEV